MTSGAALPPDAKKSLAEAAAKRDGDRLQQLLDQRALFIVELNPESRVKVRAARPPRCSNRAGYTPVIVKVVNFSTVTKELRVTSPQAGQVYAGVSPLSARRMQREPLREAEVKTANTNQFLDAEMFARPPMTPHLSGLVEYALALIHSRDAGRREATIAFDVGGTTQDLGFRAEVPVLFDIQPAVPVKLRVRDHDGAPATSFIFRDAAGHVHPPQAKRLAPDFYFQPQIYRGDSDIVLLPPGKLSVEFTRGPEYRRVRREVMIPRRAKAELPFELERWINPAASGFYSGDHHIHGAGCAHYSSPTEGVTPEDMFKQVEGEGLNVGCVLTWGPCFTYQRQFFAPGVNQLSKLTVMKYDLEISGFRLEALGHVCLLNLKDQTYPGSGRNEDEGLAFVDPARDAMGEGPGRIHRLRAFRKRPEIHTASAVKRLFQSTTPIMMRVSPRSRRRPPPLLPFDFPRIDDDRDGVLIEAELAAASRARRRRVAELRRARDERRRRDGDLRDCRAWRVRLHQRDGHAAHRRVEHVVSHTQLRLPAQGQRRNRFSCMSGERVGQGRVYVQLGKQKRLDFAAWCERVRARTFYVSDGFAHALDSK